MEAVIPVNQNISALGFVRQEKLFIDPSGDAAVKKKGGREKYIGFLEKEGRAPSLARLIQAHSFVRLYRFCHDKTIFKERIFMVFLTDLKIDDYNPVCASICVLKEGQRVMTETESTIYKTTDLF